MELLTALRVSAATLTAVALCSCAQPGITPPAGEPSPTVSRVRVVNDSDEELSNLRLLFPEEQVTIGDVAAGAASAYVEVPLGVYRYSAFQFRRGGESVVQPVTDFVGETPLPIDDYTYVLGAISDPAHRLALLDVQPRASAEP